eukprot:g18851.t1
MLPVNLTLEFSTEIVGQLRAVHSLEKQDVLLKVLSTKETEQHASLDEALRFVFNRMSPVEREQHNLTYEIVYNKNAGWHFWKARVGDTSTTSSGAAAGSSAAAAKTKGMLNEKRLALHIGDCRESKVQFPFFTKDGASSVRLQHFATLSMLHPKQKTKQQLQKDKEKEMELARRR